ncbi:hypothetical protein PAXRUDRAFT_832688, partial [Paxillus rubicundulus Ve08.2h10]
MNCPHNHIPRSLPFHCNFPSWNSPSTGIPKWVPNIIDISAATSSRFVNSYAASFFKFLLKFRQVNVWGTLNAALEKL